MYQAAFWKDDLKSSQYRPKKHNERTFQVDSSMNAVEL